MTRLAIIILVLASCNALAAEKSLVEKIAERTAKADREDPAKRGEIYTDTALDYVLLATERFGAGDSEAAKDAVAKALEYAQKAADSAKMKGKHIKQTEIKLRRCSTRLEDLARTVSVLDRDPIKNAANQIDGLRAQLLDVMFKKK